MKRLCAKLYHFVGYDGVMLTDNLLGLWTFLVELIFFVIFLYIIRH